MRPADELFAVAEYAEGQLQGRIQHLCERYHSDGTESEGDQGDADLGDGVEPLRLVMQYLHDLGGFVAGAGQLFDAAATGRSQGDLGADKKGIAYDQ